MSPSADRQIRDLTHRLAEAEATIAALLTGQVDAVIDGQSQTPVLLARAQEALRASEERYRHIVETTSEGVWVTDGAQNTIFMNRRMSEMLRCDADLTVARSPFDLLDERSRMRQCQCEEEGSLLRVHLLAGVRCRWRGGIRCRIDPRCDRAQAGGERARRTDQRSRTADLGADRTGRAAGAGAGCHHRARPVRSDPVLESRRRGDVRLAE